MKNIWDYPVKYVYGYSKAYGTTFHTGEDRPVTDWRADIPVTVNGVNIGLTGTTGKSTGIHLHVGKWGAGGHYPPKGGGEFLDDAVVTEIDTVGNTNNGKFVRVQSGEFSWVYLHLSKVNVKVGQRLELIVKPTKSEVGNMFNQAGVSDEAVTDKQYAYYMARDWKVLAQAVAPKIRKLYTDKRAEANALSAQVADLTTKLEDCKARGSSEDISYIRAKVDAIFNKLNNIFK